MNIILIFIQIVACVFAAELLAGFVHWLEDSYISEDTPLLGKLVGKPNIVHHHFPRFFTRLSWWQSSWDIVIACGVFLLGAWWLGLLGWQAWFFAFILANANEVHKWAHRTRRENGRVISFFQDLGVLQSARHHAIHHTDPKSTHYCTMTNLLNPLLQWLRFWEILEWLVLRVFGIERRDDTSVHGHGPGPEWLDEYRRVPVKTGAGAHGK